MALSAGATHTVKTMTKLEYKANSSGSGIIYPGAQIDLVRSTLRTDNLVTAATTSAGRFLLGPNNEAINLNKDAKWDRTRVEESVKSASLITDVTITGVASHTAAKALFFRPVYASDENTYTISPAAYERFIGYLWVDEKDYGILVPSVETKLAIGAAGGAGNRRIYFFPVDLNVAAADLIMSSVAGSNMIIKSYGLRCIHAVTDAGGGIDQLFDLTVDTVEQTETYNLVAAMAVNAEVTKTLSAVVEVGATQTFGIKLKTDTKSPAAGSVVVGFIVADLIA